MVRHWVSLPTFPRLLWYSDCFIVLCQLTTKFFFRLDCHLLDRRRAKHHNWKASYVMHYFLKHYNSNGKFVSKEDHPDYPHVVACVADDAPIVPNALSHAELNAVMVLGSFAAGDADEAGRTRRSAYPVSWISFMI